MCQTEVYLICVETTFVIFANVKNPACFARESKYWIYMLFYVFLSKIKKHKSRKLLMFCYVGIS